MAPIAANDEQPFHDPGLPTNREFAGSVSNYSYMGQYEKAVSQTLEHLRIDPDDALGYGNLVVQYAALNRLDEAKAVYRQAMARKLEDSGLHAKLYGIAFLQGYAAEMKSQIAWAAGQPGAEDMLLSLASDTEPLTGTSRRQGHCRCAQSILPGAAIKKKPQEDGR